MLIIILIIYVGCIFFSSYTPLVYKAYIYINIYKCSCIIRIHATSVLKLNIYIFLFITMQSTLLKIYLYGRSVFFLFTYSFVSGFYTPRIVCCYIFNLWIHVKFLTVFFSNKFRLSHKASGSPRRPTDVLPLYRFTKCLRALHIHTTTTTNGLYRPCSIL